MGVTRREDQLRQIENLEVAIETIIVTEANEAIDIGDTPDRQRGRPVNLSDFRLVHRTLRSVEKFRQPRPDELRVERTSEMNVLIAERNRKGAKELRQCAGHGMAEQRFDRRLIDAKP